MDSIDNIYSRKIEELNNIAPSFQKIGKGAYHPGLETMLDFMTFLGEPHLCFRSVHVAGTNGKGSVSHLLASLLAFSSPGMRVGLYTSPHLADFRERIKIVEVGDGNNTFSEISKEEVVEFLDRCDVFIKNHNPSFFEITTAMAFDFFAHSDIDIAIVETGLGGRIDSTNVITPELSIITSIGMDHINILGDTLSQIAAEKGGIIKPGVPVVTGQLPAEAADVIERIAAEKKSGLYSYSTNYDLARGACRNEVSKFVDKYFPEVDFDKMDLHSDAQKINVPSVLIAYSILSKKGFVPEKPEISALMNAARTTGMRGRWERLSSNPLIICDIGHNFEALTISMAQLEREASGRNLYMILGMCEDKDIDKVRILYPLNAHYCYTNAQGPRAMRASELMNIVDGSRRDRGANPKFMDSAVKDTVADAVNYVLGKVGSDDVVYIGGSSFVVAEAIPVIDK